MALARRMIREPREVESQEYFVVLSSMETAESLEYSKSFNFETTSRTAQSLSVSLF